MKEVRLIREYETGCNDLDIMMTCFLSLASANAVTIVPDPSGCSIFPSDCRAFGFVSKLGLQGVEGLCFP